jgi:hypothetical protein
VKKSRKKRHIIPSYSYLNEGDKIIVQFEYLNRGLVPPNLMPHSSSRDPFLPKDNTNYDIDLVSRRKFRKARKKVARQAARYHLADLVGKRRKRGGDELSVNEKRDIVKRAAATQSFISHELVYEDIYKAAMKLKKKDGGV